jgi:hypothetical protein
VVFIVSRDVGDIVVLHRHQRLACRVDPRETSKLRHVLETTSTQEAVRFMEEPKWSRFRDRARPRFRRCPPSAP